MTLVVSHSSRNGRSLLAFHALPLCPSKKKEIKCRSHLDQVYLSAGVQMSFVSEKDGMTAPVPSGGSLALVSMSLFIYFEWLQSGKPQIWESLAQKALGKMPSSPSPTGASQVQDSVN